MKALALATHQATESTHGALRHAFLVCAFLGVLASIVVWHGIRILANSHSATAQTGLSIASLDIAILVFREGLECVLVIAAITAGMTGSPRSRTSVVMGVVAGSIATVLTWFAAIRVLNDLGQNVPALALQAATGLLAVIVLLVVMNWFFHKVYWTGWISFHNRRKRKLLESSRGVETSDSGLSWGMALLGFTSFYREGFEVVLFLQGYRLRLGNEPVFWGASLGIVFSGIVAILTFVAHRKLPYRKMLVSTGILLALVLVVMVGEQAQEMQLTHWLPTTRLTWLSHLLPDWLGVWFSIFPTVEGILAQVGAALLVIGSYFVANRRTS